MENKTRLYTVCYLEKDDDILMLYRNKMENDINEGKWIGVGGKIEFNESPFECVKREVFEETGLKVNNLFFRGIILFVYGNYNDYIYVFSSDDFSGNMIDCDEGELHYINRNKVLDLNIWKGDAVFLKKIINKEMDFFFLKMTYDNDNNLIEVIDELKNPPK